MPCRRKAVSLHYLIAKPTQQMSTRPNNNQYISNIGEEIIFTPLFVVLYRHHPHASYEALPCK